MSDLVQDKIDSLFDAIAHGDEDHRKWLKEAIENHFQGIPVPTPVGKGDKERLESIAKYAYVIDAVIIRWLDTMGTNIPEWAKAIEQLRDVRNKYLLQTDIDLMEDLGKNSGE